jgi:hypothetical protein
VAARLGLDETTIRRLQTRGHLRRLTLTQPEIRERLYHAHLAYLLSPAGDTRGSEGYDRRRLPETPPRARPVARPAPVRATKQANRSRRRRPEELRTRLDGVSIDVLTTTCETSLIRPDLA